jgi:hypothetical protein
MAEVFKFQKKKKVYFNVEIDNEVISLPMGASMPTGLYDKLANITKLTEIIKGNGSNSEKLEANSKVFNELIDIYESIIPKEVFERLGFKDWAVEDLIALFNAWQEAALKFQGISLGESQASASS